MKFNVKTFLFIASLFQSTVYVARMYVRVCYPRSQCMDEVRCLSMFERNFAILLVCTAKTQNSIRVRIVFG